MIIDKYFSNERDTKRLRIQPSTDDDTVMFLTQDHYIVLEREQVERVSGFLEKFLNNTLQKSDDEWIPSDDEGDDGDESFFSRLSPP